MEHYCTLFDIGFLPQGMALHASLIRHAGDFTLWILCIDENVEIALKKLDLKNVVLIPLKEIETPELLNVKRERTRGEYCWTLTPFLPTIVMKKEPTVKRVTYIDADCWFVNDPKMILKEMDLAKKSVLITPHNYVKKYDKSKKSGIYCVQFVPFVNSNKSNKILLWWQERCLEWCFSKYENGKFGDQMYLDLWPVIFSKDVHVLKDLRKTIGPWNALKFKDQVDKNFCMYHFHGLRIYGNEKIKILLNQNYSLPKSIFNFFYPAYINDIKSAIKTILQLNTNSMFVVDNINIVEKIKRIRRILFINEKWGKINMDNE